MTAQCAVIELAAALEALSLVCARPKKTCRGCKMEPDPQDVAILEARLAAIDAAARQAEAAVDSAAVAVQAAQRRLDAAEASVAQAQSELDLVDVQIGKLTVHSPIDGVVLGRNVEAGEVVQMGAPVITVGGLARLLITVYLSEASYGQISLGQTAKVTVDSFPGKFQAGRRRPGEFTNARRRKAEKHLPREHRKPGWPAQAGMLLMSIE
jgi:multidrug resistance efflux pump